VAIVRPLRYSINVTLDGCVDHRAGTPNELTHRHAAETIGRADALLFGRVTYQMMEAGWRGPSGDRPAWMEPFAESINAAKKYVVSSTLSDLDWNAEPVRGDLGDAVRRLKEEPGDGLYTGGVMLPLALADMGLIDEYEFVVHPTIAGHGPRLFDGLSESVRLTAVGTEELGDGIVATRYVPRR
jgi:dihydrofolate reductase